MSRHDEHTAAGLVIFDLHLRHCYAFPKNLPIPLVCSDVDVLITRFFVWAPRNMSCAATAPITGSNILRMGSFSWFSRY